MSDTKQQILAALRKLGPSSPLVIADKIGVAGSACGYHLRAMSAAGELKAQGKSNSRVYALPDQEFPAAGAPPQAQKPKKKKKAGKRGKAKKARATLTRTTAPEFIPGLTADGGLVIVGHADAPLTFNPEHTSKLADLLLAHFEA